MSKLVTVFGATGAQGGPVARALIARGGYRVRGVTRNPDSEKAQALKASGIEVVKANLDDPTSVETAVQGAYGVFLVTDYWGIFAKLQDPDKSQEAEVAHGKLVGDACKKAGVKHLVYSGLEHVLEIMGKPCPHLDSKARIEKYLDDIGVPNTSVRYPFYFDNFATLTRPQKQDDGTFVLTLPVDGPIPAIGVEDGGEAVASVFTSPSEFIGKKIGLSGDKLTITEYVTILSKVTGKTIKYNQVTPDQFAQFPFPGADELAVMFEFFTSGNFHRDRVLTQRLNPKVRRFEEWATDNKQLFAFLSE